MTVIDDQTMGDTFQCAEDLTLIDYLDDARTSLARLLNQLRGLTEKSPELQKSVEEIIEDVSALREARWGRAQAILKAASEEEYKRSLE